MKTRFTIVSLGEWLIIVGFVRWLFPTFLTTNVLIIMSLVVVVVAVTTATNDLERQLTDIHRRLLKLEERRPL